MTQNRKYMTVESCNIDNLPYVQVQVVEPCHDIPILISDLPDNIPMDKISGNLDVTRIDNLDDYLINFQYELDGGSP